MDMKKKEYTKPSIRLVEWEFSEAICNTVYTASPTQCIRVHRGTGGNSQENRLNSDGWTRVDEASTFGR